MNTDYNCFIGSWPFIKRRQVDFDGLCKMHEKHGIETGYVSSLNAVFYNDPFEGDFEVSKIIKNSGYLQAVSINPMLPNTVFDIHRADESFDYSAIRIYPTVHGYDFETPQFIEFYHMAVQKRKPLLIHCSFGDLRLDYLLRQTPLNIESLERLMKNGTKTPMVLCNIRLGDIENLAGSILKSNNIYVDMSEMRHSMFALNDLKEKGLTDKIVFGSFYPVFDFLAAHMHFMDVEPTMKSEILKREI